MSAMDVVFATGGSLILILLTVIGFFLKQVIHVVKELIRSVDNLSKVVTVLEANAKNAAITWQEKHGVINDRLKEHGDGIDSNAKEIIRIKEHLHMT